MYISALIVELSAVCSTVFYFSFWCLGSESNQQPVVFQTTALTAYELPRHIGEVKVPQPHIPF